MLCLSQYQSDSTLLTRTYLSSGGTAGRNVSLPHIFPISCLFFSFFCNFELSGRIPLYIRSKTSVPRSRFPVPSIAFLVFDFRVPGSWFPRVFALLLSVTSFSKIPERVTFSHVSFNLMRGREFGRKVQTRLQIKQKLIFS